jgi:hypothetical protein
MGTKAAYRRPKNIEAQARHEAVRVAIEQAGHPVSTDDLRSIVKPRQTLREIEAAIVKLRTRGDLHLVRHGRSLAGPSLWTLRP